MPCSPEEMNQLGDLLTNGKLGETHALSIDLPAPTQNPAVVETNRKMGLFAGLRTQRGAFGDWFAVNVIDPLTQLNITKENFIAKSFKEYNEALAPLGLPRRWFSKSPSVSREMDEKLGAALEVIDKDGFYMGAPGAFDTKVIQAAQNIRKIYNRLFDEFKIDPDTYIRGYRPLVRQRPDGIFWRDTAAPAEVAFKSKLTPDDIIFYHELERKGGMINPDPTSSASFISYIHGLGNAKMLRPGIENLEKTKVNEFFGFKVYRGPEGNTIPVTNDAIGYSMWRDLVHHMFGGPTALDMKATHSLQTLTRMMGYDADTRSLYQISQTMGNMFYSGALGLRPASIIRQATQIVPTYAELGGKYTMIGLQKAMEPGAIKGLMERNLLSSPLENLTEAVAVQRGVGRVLSDVTESTLKAFSAVDRFTRAATAFGAEAKFDDYMARGIVDKLKIRKDLKDEVMRLVGTNNIEAARERYVFSTVADLQYSFGRANRPASFRGALGNLAGIFLSYPLNSFELARVMTKRALPERLGGEGDPMPLARLMFTTAAMLGVGSEFLNADLRSATLLGAMPHSMAFPKTALDTWNMGQSNLEWATGNLFNVGETDYHKHQRAEANTTFARDMRMFVPGGLFFFEDIPRALDEGSLTRMLALTPKAAAINEQNRINNQERQREAQSQRLPTLRGYDVNR